MQRFAVNVAHHVRAALERIQPSVEKHAFGVPEPPEPGWAVRLDADTLDYLYAESHQRLVDLRESADRQLRKILFIAAAATFAIGTTGLLERWEFNFGDSPVTSLCSVGALAAWLIVVVLWLAALLPRERSIGISPVWLAHRAHGGGGAAELKAHTIEAQVLAVAQNLRHHAAAEHRVIWATRFIALEVLLLVLAEVLRAAAGVP